MQPIRLQSEGSRLLLKKNGTEHMIDLQHRIWLACKHNDRIYVLFDPSSNADVPESNIVCLNEDGDHIWSVENPNRAESLGERIRFDSMGFYDDSTLYARGRSSDYWIDSNTGKITRSVWTK